MKPFSTFVSTTIRQNVGIHSHYRLHREIKVSPHLNNEPRNLATELWLDSASLSLA